MKNLLIFPFGGNSREIIGSILSINQNKPTWNILGFIDDDKETWHKNYGNIKVLGDSKKIKKYPDSYILALPGNPDNYSKRALNIKKLGIKSTKFTTIIDPSVKLSLDSKVGYNTVIMSNVVISPGVKIGNHVIILPNTVISHDCLIENYTIIGAGVNLAGYVSIKENCYIGTGTNVKEKTVIGEYSLIGLGSNVIKNIPARVIAAGNPAKILRKI